MPRASEKAVPEKLGRQTPTAAVVLPYTTTHGQEAIDLYNTTGRTAQQWQKLLLYDILAENEDGLWVHTKFGYSVPRRNGKNEIAAMRELYGLQRGENILHTAHRTTTSHAAWERLCSLLDKAKIEFITCDIQDENGVFVPRADTKVTFTCEGGSVLGTDNGNAACVEPMRTNVKTAFNGKVLCVCRHDGKTGTLTVTATADGLTAGSVNVEKMGG